MVAWWHDIEEGVQVAAEVAVPAVIAPMTGGWGSLLLGALYGAAVYTVDTTFEGKSRDAAIAAGIGGAIGVALGGWGKLGSAAVAKLLTPTILGGTALGEGAFTLFGGSSGGSSSGSSSSSSKFTPLTLTDYGTGSAKENTDSDTARQSAHISLGMFGVWGPVQNAKVGAQTVARFPEAATYIGDVFTNCGDAGSAPTPDTPTTGQIDALMEAIWSSDADVSGTYSFTSYSDLLSQLADDFTSLQSYDTTVLNSIASLKKTDTSGASEYTGNLTGYVTDTQVDINKALVQLKSNLSSSPTNFTEPTDVSEPANTTIDDEWALDCLQIALASVESALSGLETNVEDLATEVEDAAEEASETSSGSGDSGDESSTEADEEAEEEEEEEAEEEEEEEDEEEEKEEEAEQEEEDQQEESEEETEEQDEESEEEQEEQEEEEEEEEEEKQEEQQEDQEEDEEEEEEEEMMMSQMMEEMMQSAQSQNLQKLQPVTGPTAPVQTVTGPAAAVQPVTEPPLGGPSGPSGPAATEVAPVTGATGPSGPSAPQRTPGADGSVVYTYPDGRTQKVSVIVAGVLDSAFGNAASTDAQAAYARTPASWQGKKYPGSRVDPYKLMTGDVVKWEHRTAVVVAFGSDAGGTLEVIVDGKMVAFDAEMHDAQGDFGQLIGFFHPAGIEISATSAPDAGAVPAQGGDLGAAGAGPTAIGPATPAN